MSTRRRAFLGVMAGAAFAPRLAQAQIQGPGQLRIVVPFTAGSGTDVVVRVLADALHQTSGVNAIVDNKSGANTVIGSSYVARARPDGSTILYTTGGHTTNAALMKNLPYDPIADFTPITLLSRSSGFALLVGEKSPYQTMDQFIAAAKAKPGGLTFGSSGIGNTTHVMGVLFGRGVGVDMLHIPFKGTPTTELIQGTVDSAFLSPTVAAAQIRAGQLRALGISGAARSTLIPQVPTFAELGLKVQDIPSWSGAFGPPKMTPETIKSVYDTIVKAAQTKMFSDFVRDSGGHVEAMPPEPFRLYVTSEIERFRKLLPPLGIQMG